MEARLPAAARLSQLTSENCNVGEIRLNFSFNYKTAGMCCTHVQMICRETNMPKQLQNHIQLHVCYVKQSYTLTHRLSSYEHICTETQYYSIANISAANETLRRLYKYWNAYFMF